MAKIQGDPCLIVSKKAERKDKNAETFDCEATHTYKFIRIYMKLKWISSKTMCLGIDILKPKKEVVYI